MVNQLKKINNLELLLFVVISLVYIYLALMQPFNGDSSTYFYIGKSYVTNGLIPYLDNWDHKGVSLYLLNVISYYFGLKTNSGIFLLEGLLLFISLYLCIKIFSRNLIKGSGKKYLVLIFLISYFQLFDLGNLPDTWSLPFQLLVYSILFDALNRGKKKLNNGYSIAIGMCMSLGFLFIFFTRPVNAVGVLLAVVIVAISLRDHYKEVFFGAVLGCVAFIAPLYMWIFDSTFIEKMYQQFIQYNFLYSSERPDNLREYLLIFYHWLSIPLVTFTTVVFSYYFLVEKRRLLDKKIFTWILLLIIDFIFLHFSGRDVSHYNILTLSAMFFLVAQLAIGFKENSISFNLYKLAFLACLPVLIHSAYLIVKNILNASLLSSKSAEMKVLKNYLNELAFEDEKIYVFGPAGATRYLIGTNRISASKYIFYYPILGDKKFNVQARNEFTAELNKNKPSIIIEDQSPKCLDGESLPFEEFCSYLKNNYVKTAFGDDPDTTIVDPYSKEKINVWKRNSAAKLKI